MVILKVFLKYHTTYVLWDYEITKVKPKTLALTKYKRLVIRYWASSRVLTTSNKPWTHKTLENERRFGLEILAYNEGRSV